MAQVTSLIQVTQGVILLKRLRQYNPVVWDNMDDREHVQISSLIAQNGTGSTDIDLAEFMLHVVKGWV